MAGSAELLGYEGSVGLIEIRLLGLLALLPLVTHLHTEVLHLSKFNHLIRVSFGVLSSVMELLLLRLFLALISDFILAD